MSPKLSENLYVTALTIDEDQISIALHSKKHEIKEVQERSLTNNSINEGEFLEKHVSPLVSNNDLRLITALTLENCSLTELQADLCKLMNLKELSVSRNNLTQIPLCLYEGLSSLQHLNLSRNKITSFAKAPKCVGSIIKIDLSVNSFNELPPWIFRNDLKLKELVYSSNLQICSLNGDKVKPLNYSVRRLEIKNCQIVGNDFNYLKLFGVLNHLDISNEEKVRSNIIESVDGLFALLNLQAYIKVLVLKKLRIPELPISVRNFYNLEELHLEFNNLNYLHEDLVILEKLRVLKVGHNHLYKLPFNLKTMKNLEVIEVQFNYISDVDLRNMPSLKLLDLYHNEISSVEIDNSIELIDLEMNYLEDLEEICADYNKKRDKLREKIGMVYGRVTGCIIEDEVIPEVSSSCSEEGDEFFCPAEGFQKAEVEEENWDDVYSKDFGELTLSDSEYQGDVVSSRSQSASTKSSNDNLYDYLYEDAD